VRGKGQSTNNRHISTATALLLVLRVCVYVLNTGWAEKVIAIIIATTLSAANQLS